MGSVLDRRLVTANFIELLKQGTGKQVGDHAAPGSPLAYPYCIVYTIDGGELWGSLRFPESDALVIYQVTSVGERRDQAEWMADRVRRTILNRISSGFQVPMGNPEGWVINDRRSHGGVGQVNSEGLPPNQVFSIPERFALSVTPA